MNYKYTASELYRRATELADVKNTDFLTYEEKLGYVNDAFSEEVQWARNIGEKIYVKEVALVGSGNGGRGFVSYNLPDDFYSVVSIKAGGFPLKRKAESELSNGYEIVNNELRVYGSFTGLILEYNMKPLTITFPDKTLEYNTNLGVVVDTYGNNVLYEVDDEYYLWNVVSNETASLGTIRYVTDVKMGRGHIAMYSENEGDSILAYFSLTGQQLFTIEDVVFEGFAIDENGLVSYKTEVDGVKVLKTLNTEMVGYYDIKLPDYYILDNTIYNLVDEEISKIDYDTIFPLTEYDGRRNVFLAKKGSKHFLVMIEYGKLHIEELDVKTLIFYGYTNRGIVSSNGTNIQVISWVPETLLNLPNDFYFSATAADVAIKIAMKQNANFQGLQLLVQNMKDAFVNSLNSNGALPRMRIV